jgi:hypothetical protein
MATLQTMTVDATDAMRLPTGTSAQRPASPQTGAVRLNTDFNSLETYNGSYWAPPGLPTYRLGLLIDAGDPDSYPGSGTTCTNLINSGTGTLVNGVGWNSGNGGYFTFDGSNDGIRITGGLGDLNVNEYTISSWNYSTVYNSLSGFMFEKTTNNAVNTSYSLFYNNNNLIYNRTYGGRNDLTQTTSTYVSNSRWNNVCSTYDGLYKKTYVNGKLTAQVVMDNNTIASNATGYAFIGCYGNVSGHYFNGRISVTLVWKRALSQTEIESQFNAYRWRYGI